MGRPTLALLLTAACASDDPPARSEQAPPRAPTVLWERSLHHEVILDRGVAVASDGSLLVPGEQGTGQAAIMRLTVHPQTGIVEQAPFVEGKAYLDASLSEGDINQDGVDDLLVLGRLYEEVLLRAYDRVTGELILRRTVPADRSLHDLALVQADADPMWEMLITSARGVVLLDEDASTLHEAEWPRYMGRNLADLDADGVPEVFTSEGEILDGLTLTVTGTLPVQDVEQVWPIDADEDGDTDLLVYDLTQRNVWTLVDGPTLTARWTRTVGPRPPAHIDVDGDGDKDLAFTSVPPGAPVVWLDTLTGDPGGSLASSDQTWLPESLFVWDHDGDGSPELLTGGAMFERSYDSTHPGAVARLWDPQSGWLARPPLVHGSDNLVTGDVDGDGSTEVLIGGQGDMAADAAMYDGRTGELLLHWEMPVLPEAKQSMVLADLDGNGDDELVTFNERGETVTYDLNRQALGPPRVLGNLGSSLEVVRDVSGVDALVGYGTDEPLTWWGGGRTWSRRFPWTQTAAFASADWDGDGVEDVLAVDGQHLYVYDQQNGNLIHQEFWGLWTGIETYKSAAGLELILSTYDPPSMTTGMNRYIVNQNPQPHLFLVESNPIPGYATILDEFAIFEDKVLIPQYTVWWWNLSNGTRGKWGLPEREPTIWPIRPEPIEGGWVFKTAAHGMIAVAPP